MFVPCFDKGRYWTTGDVHGNCFIVSYLSLCSFVVR